MASSDSCPLEFELVKLNLGVQTRLHFNITVEQFCDKIPQVKASPTGFLGKIKKAFNQIDCEMQSIATFTLMCIYHNASNYIICSKHYRDIRGTQLLNYQTAS